MDTQTSAKRPMRLVYRPAANQAFLHSLQANVYPAPVLYQSEEMMP
jgi:hypothetical protein